MRFFLITILVTTVTATKETALKHVQESARNLPNYDYRLDIMLYNAKILAEWEIRFVDTNTEVHFQIKAIEENSSLYCDGAAAFSLATGPKFCLFKIIFHFDIKDGKDTVQLGLLFRKDTDNWKWEVVIANVFPRLPYKVGSIAWSLGSTKLNVICVLFLQQTELTPGAQFVTIIPKDAIAKLWNKESFKMKTRWLKTILERGIIPLDSELKKELVENLVDKEMPAYYAKPVAMDEFYLNEIKKLPMLRPITYQNDAEAGTSDRGVPPTDEDLKEFDRMFE